jgi:cysteine-rich repeat protein
VNLSLPGAVPNPGGPNYLCEFDLSTSPNTRGLFDLNFIFPPESAPTSMLFAGGTFDPFVEFLVDEYQPLTIAVFNCGDGIVDLPEQCDDGALNSDEPGALCRTDCTLGGCGDGIVDFPTGETCDGSAAPGCPFCRPPGGPAACTCCGDGVVQQAAGEDCDDAGGESGDGCSSACTIEPEFGCSGEPSLCVRIPRIPAVSRQGMILLTAVLLAAVLATGPRRRRPRRT